MMEATVEMKTTIGGSGKIVYDFMTSLKNISMAKIATTMWMSKYIQQETLIFFHKHAAPISDITVYGLLAKFKSIERKVVADLPKLLLANSLTNELSNIVPLVGDSIFEWIRYHDICIFDTKISSAYSAVDQISMITFTARGKIDYTQTAKNILDNQDSCLSLDHKYKLACAYCFEDKIAVLSPIVLDKDYLCNVEIDKYPMVYFWTACITGDNNILDNPLYSQSYFYNHPERNDNVGINEHIFYLILHTSSCKNLNVIPIIYMWDKLNEEEKTKNLDELFLKLSGQDLQYALLSSLSFQQQFELLNEYDCLDHFLKTIYKNWFWRENFLKTVNHFWDIMDTSTFLYVLNVVLQEMIDRFQNSKCIYRYEQCKLVFMQLLKKGLNLLENVHDYPEFEELLDNLFIEGDLDIKWDLLNMIIQYTLSSEKDLKQLKKKVLFHVGEKLYEYLWKKDAVDKMERFLSWAFRSKGKMNEYRENLALGEMCKNELIDIVESDTVDFIELEKMFKWCSSNNQMTINSIKAKIPEEYPDVICKLIKTGSYETLDKLLTWFISANIEEVNNFKKSFFQCCPYEILSLIESLIQQNDQLQSLEKFVHWCFENDYEIFKFKEWLLYPGQDAYRICLNLLRDSLFLANQFISWCYTTQMQIDNFKNKLMLHEITSEFFRDISRKDPSNKMLTRAIQFFNPSINTIIEFKYNNKFSNWIENFSIVLENYLKNYLKNYLTNYLTNYL